MWISESYDLGLLKEDVEIDKMKKNCIFYKNQNVHYSCSRLYSLMKKLVI